MEPVVGMKYKARMTGAVYTYEGMYDEERSILLDPGGDPIYVPLVGFDLLPPEPGDWLTWREPVDYADFPTYYQVTEDDGFHVLGVGYSENGSPMGIRTITSQKGWAKSFMPCAVPAFVPKAGQWYRHTSDKVDSYYLVDRVEDGWACGKAYSPKRRNLSTRVLLFRLGSPLVERCDPPIKPGDKLTEMEYGIPRVYTVTKVEGGEVFGYTKSNPHTQRLGTVEDVLTLETYDDNIRAGTWLGWKEGRGHWSLSSYYRVDWTTDVSVYGTGYAKDGTVLAQDMLILHLPHSPGSGLKVIDPPVFEPIPKSDGSIDASAYPPPECQPVLLYVPKFREWIIDELVQGSTVDYDHLPLAEISHWMYLPEAP